MAPGWRELRPAGKADGQKHASGRRDQLGCADLASVAVWPGVRRAGLPRQSPPLTTGQRRRRRRLDTGEVDQVLVPCGNTLASVCPACADRAKTLRAAQCREGWHLEDEPDITPDPATQDQKWWITLRAEAQQHRDRAAAAGDDTIDLDELITELDDQITGAGMRGKAASAKPARRHRSTRRRQDAPDLPKRRSAPARSARPTPRRTARSFARPCSSR
jgi:hypothetical protein